MIGARRGEAAVPHHHDDDPRGGLLPHWIAWFGKTVQLLRLKQDLLRRGFAVVMFSAEDYLNMHEPLDVVDVLFFLVGAISDQAVEYDLIEQGDSATSRGMVETGTGSSLCCRVVTLTEQRMSPEDLDAQRDLSVSLGRLGSVARDLGDPATAATHCQQALDIDRRLAEQLGTERALQDLQAEIFDLARTEEELGNADAATALRAEMATVSDRLAALSDEPPPD